jgi:hypothetical protein
MPIPVINAQIGMRQITPTQKAQSLFGSVNFISGFGFDTFRRDGGVSSSTGGNGLNFPLSPDSSDYGLVGAAGSILLDGDATFRRIGSHRLCCNPALWEVKAMCRLVLTLVHMGLQVSQRGRVKF